MRLLAFSNVLLALLATPAVGAPTDSSLEERQIGTKRAIIWGSAQQLVEPGNLPPQPFNGTAVLANSTIRQTVKIYQDSNQIRLRISNAFGLLPLKIDSIAIAAPFNNSAGGSAIVAKTSTKVTFDGNDFVTIPKASLAVSDPINFKVKAKDILAISLYLSAGQSGGAISGHPGSRTDSWLTFGNQVSAANFTTGTVASTAHWYFISGIEGQVPQGVKTLSIVGDSITDGRGSTTNFNNRWPDYLFNRLQADRRTSQIAIANQGLGGNNILSEGLGPNALSRIDRDVLALPGIGYGMIFEGVNDIGTTNPSPAAQKALSDNLISAFKQFSSRVRGSGLPVFAATIAPFGKSFYDEPTGERDKTRVRVNEWLRTAGAASYYDAIIDFDKVLRDPKNVSSLAPGYDGGDGLHPNLAGFQAMANAFNLNIFR